MKCLIGLLLLSAGLWAQPPAVVIRGARVVDGTGAPARLLTVVIRGTKIEAVAADAAAPAGARVIDAAGQTLTPGAISPADVSGFAGVSFEVRGEAAGRLLMQTYRVRNTDAYAAPFTIGADWQTLKIPFASLKRRTANAGSWDATDGRVLLFELAGSAGSSVWMELDNVRFY